MTLLTKFWEDNHNLAYPEDWAEGNTYTNSFVIPTYMLAIGHPELPGGGEELQYAVWDSVVDTIQEWTGQKLQPSSLYGIRVYKEGAILAPHVDRLPLVSSAIINVAQDVDEDWPIEVIAHDGKAHNITMKPGDLVLYESHSVIHGRPFPLKGRYYANVFIHFVPETSDENELPTYMVPGSLYAMDWMKENNKIPKEQVRHILSLIIHLRASVFVAPDWFFLMVALAMFALVRAIYWRTERRTWPPTPEKWTSYAGSLNSAEGIWTRPIPTVGGLCTKQRGLAASK